MKTKYYREFHSKEYMYGFIGENRNNIKRYNFRKYYTLYDNLYYILEYEKFNEKINDITLGSKRKEV